MKILVALLTSLVLNIANAQALLMPTIGGMRVHCTDSTGAPVFTVIAPVSDAAISSINPQTGQRLITINPAIVFRMSPLLQLFVYAHECGHHLSGDVVAGLYGIDNPLREENADRIGIRLMRDQLRISLSQAQDIASTFSQNPPMPPHYLPGPMRAQWIVDCYKTADTYCGHGSQFYGSSQAVSNATESTRDENAVSREEGTETRTDAPVVTRSAQQPLAQGATSVSPKFCNELRALIHSAINHFSGFQHYKMDGASTCSYTQIDNASSDYTCSWAYDDEAASKKIYEDSMTVAKQCFPDADVRGPAHDPNVDQYDFFLDQGRQAIFFHRTKYMNNKGNFDFFLTIGGK